MATHFEVFNKLRDLGRSLDKISNTLPADGAPEETNKARACIQLRTLLAEAKNFKEETNRSITDAKRRQNLDSVLELCEKQTCKIREDIESLENHLVKYGYKRPSEKLPEVLAVDSSEEFDNDNSDECNSESPQNSSSDKENHSPRSEHETDVENTKLPEQLQPIKQSKPEEVDLLATPVRPTTVTKFIQHLNPHEEHPQSPCPFSTPESLELPSQPATRTPMIKSTINFDSPPVNNSDDNSLVDDFPTPPTFATPGLKQYGKKTNFVETLLHNDVLNTPPPPSFTSLNRLNLDELQSNKTKIMSQEKQKSPAQLQEQKSRTYQFPDITFERYQRLPDSIRKQFSLEQINFLIKQTGSYLMTRTEVNSTIVTDDDLKSVLQLGPFTRIFALTMLKLEFFTIKKSGVYSVHDKMIV